jgi:RNA polymerase sigma-70 factor (ECF subfamily)
MNPDWDDYRQARRGDSTAWSRLWARHRARLVTLALLTCGRLDSAEDCVQEAFARLVHSPPPDEHGGFAGYLSTVVFRLALKEHARLMRSAELSRTESLESGISPLDGVVRNEEERITMAAIQSLDDTHRTVLLLRFYGECSYNEISELTGVPVGTVKSRLFYAVKACREFLSVKGVTK